MLMQFEHSCLHPLVIDGVKFRRWRWADTTTKRYPIQLDVGLDYGPFYPRTISALAIKHAFHSEMSSKVQKDTWCITEAVTDRVSYGFVNQTAFNEAMRLIPDALEHAKLRTLFYEDSKRKPKMFGKTAFSWRSHYTKSEYPMYSMRLFSPRAKNTRSHFFSELEARIVQEFIARFEGSDDFYQPVSAMDTQGSDIILTFGNLADYKSFRKDLKTIIMLFKLSYNEDDYA